MKYLLSFGTFFLLVIAGCVQPEKPTSSFPMKQCPAPLAKIHLESITAGQNDLDITPEFIKTLLDKNLQDNCLVLTDKPDKDTYETKITYKTSIQSSSSEKIASSEERNTIQSEITLSLKNQMTTKIFVGKNAIRINGKKILSIGQDASITQDDKNHSIAEAFKAAYNSAVSSFQTDVK
ncbi:hypothetical protein [Helicobacter sp. 11S02596-1]|uniref:hypothetical protein n=1 Tax=Helicobacter sp. 11S02596-1 TaxID=1476194 RepID=UPI000BA54DA8|nr:hypothetical protein [Helicobacter sp. 11S02596-1]PAF42777.1 hypothetical protein BJI48_05820 [Helicobacter sp. 11S02596-1]